MKNQTNNKNLSIWKQVEKTNPAFTKQVKINGRMMTTINATYQLEMATTIFGAYGDGFGISKITHEQQQVDTDILLIAHATFFYRLDEKVVEFPISASMKMLYIAGNGRVIFDTDAYKKIETDITTKALSKLGFSADIFKGLYDDNKYVSDVIQQFKNEEIELIIQSITEANTIQELTNIYNNLGNFQKDTEVLKKLSNRKLEVNIK